jgi:hypothetical protein
MYFFRVVAVMDWPILKGAMLSVRTVYILSSLQLGMAMHGYISFVPEVLPIAPRPIAGELISSWLLRVSFANSLTLAELVQGIHPGRSQRRQ